MNTVPHVESLGHYSFEVIMPSLLFTFVPHWLSYLFATVIVVRIAEGSNDTTCLLRPHPQRRSLGCLVLEAVAVLPKDSLLEGYDQAVSLEVVLQRGQVVPRWSLGNHRDL